MTKQIKIRSMQRKQQSLMMHIGSEELLEYLMPINPTDPYMTKQEKEALEIKIFRERVRMKLRGNKWE